MRYNTKHKIYVTKDGVCYKISGTTNQYGYHSDGSLKLLKLNTAGAGYLKAHGVYVHRLVYETFVGEIPDGYEIDHINRNKTDNRLENLRLVTHKQNCSNRTACYSQARRKALSDKCKLRWALLSEDEKQSLSEKMKAGCAKRVYHKRGSYKKRGIYA